MRPISRAQWPCSRPLVVFYKIWLNSPPGIQSIFHNYLSTVHKSKTSSPPRKAFPHSNKPSIPPFQSPLHQPTPPSFTMSSHWLIGPPPHKPRRSSKKTTDASSISTHDASIMSEKEKASSSWREVQEKKESTLSKLFTRPKKSSDAVETRRDDYR